MGRKNSVHAALESLVAAIDNGSLIVAHSDRLATNADIADARTALRGEAREPKLIKTLENELAALKVWEKAEGLPKDVRDGIDISISKIDAALEGRRLCRSQAEGVMTIEFTATKLRNGKYAIRPKGCLGTCGAIGGKLWTVQYVNRIPKNMKLEG